MKACARFNKIPIVGYFLNALSILEVKFANLAALSRHLYGRDDWWPPFFKGDLTRTFLQSFMEFLLWGIFQMNLNGF